jgi:hypothetical protein
MEDYVSNFLIVEVLLFFTTHLEEIFLHISLCHIYASNGAIPFLNFLIEAILSNFTTGWRGLHVHRVALYIPHIPHIHMFNCHCLFLLMSKQKKCVDMAA